MKAAAKRSVCCFHCQTSAFDNESSRRALPPSGRCPSKSCYPRVLSALADARIKDAIPVYCPQAGVYCTQAEDPIRAGTYPGVGQRWRARGNSALYTGSGLVPADSKRYPRALAIPRDGRRVAPACVQCARIAPFTRASARGVERPGIARLSKASVSGLRTVRAGSTVFSFREQTFFKAPSGKVNRGRRTRAIAL